MIYTITLNPSIDYYATSDNYRTGHINRTTSESMRPGGKGINVSMVLGNLGQKNIALGFVAGFTGREIKRLLDGMGVENDLIFSETGCSRINVKIRKPIEGVDGKTEYEETDLNGMGPDISEELMEKLYEQLDTLLPGDYLVLSGGKTASMSATVYGDIITRMREKKVRTVVDASGDLLLNSLLGHPFLIKPNEEELSQICKEEIHTEGDVIKLASRLQEMGAVNVLVSRGEKGAVLLTEDGTVLRSDAPKGNVMSTIGAGDSLLAGFIDGYIRTGDYEEALKEGICAGSASAFGDGLATAQEIQNLYDLTF